MVAQQRPERGGKAGNVAGLLLNHLREAQQMAESFPDVNLVLYDLKGDFWGQSPVLAQLLNVPRHPSPLGARVLLLPELVSELVLHPSIKLLTIHRYVLRPIRVPVG